MASTSFARKKYGRVKPVKQKKVKTPKPSVRELKLIYRAIAKEGAWTKIDNLCHAMHWWEKAIVWVADTKEMTTGVARLFDKAIRIKNVGMASHIEKEKGSSFIAAIELFERAIKVYFKAPSIKKALALGEESAKKVKQVKNSLNARYSKLLSLIAAMFPSCSLSIEIVPRISDAASGNFIDRKFDHTLGVMYFSRSCVKDLQTLVRTKGVLAFAIQEGYWLARSMSIPKDATGRFIVDKEKLIDNYVLLMSDFYNWAVKYGPSKLVRKPSKKKEKDNG